jgi:hypothetical protein
LTNDGVYGRINHNWKDDQALRKGNSMKKPVLFGLLTLAMVPLWINPGFALSLGIAVIFAATLKTGGRNV